MDSHENQMNWLSKRGQWRRIPSLCIAWSSGCRATRATSGLMLEAWVPASLCSLLIVVRSLRTLLNATCAIQSIRILESGLNQIKPDAKDGYKRLHHRITYLVTFKHEVFAETFESSGTLIIRPM